MNTFKQTLTSLAIISCLCVSTHSAVEAKAKQSPKEIWAEQKETWNDATAGQKVAIVVVGPVVAAIVIPVVLVVGTTYYGIKSPYYLGKGVWKSGKYMYKGSKKFATGLKCEVTCTKGVGAYGGKAFGEQVARTISAIGNKEMSLEDIIWYVYASINGATTKDPKFAKAEACWNACDKHIRNFACNYIATISGKSRNFSMLQFAFNMKMINHPFVEDKSIKKYCLGKLKTLDEQNAFKVNYNLFRTYDKKIKLGL